MIRWSETQMLSGELLLKALDYLIESEIINDVENISESPGNYIIFESRSPIYIGQSLNVKSRLKQHLKSEKYKNRKIYFKLLPNIFGRKELEEFGCYFLGNLENKFHHSRRFSVDSKARVKWEVVQSNCDSLLIKGKDLFEKQKEIDWPNINLPNEPGVYALIREGTITYIGEGISLNGRYLMHNKRTRMSILRRKIATEILGLSLKTKIELGYLSSRDKKKSHLSNEEDLLVDDYLKNCQIKCLEVQIGRLELEAHMITTIKPWLNSK